MHCALGQDQLHNQAEKALATNKLDEARILYIQICQLDSTDVGARMMLGAIEKEKGNLTNSRAIIDACRPFHWKDDFPLVNSPSPETAKEAREKWGYLCE